MQSGHAVMSISAPAPAVAVYDIAAHTAAHFLFFKGDIAAAALVAVRIYDRLCADGTNEVFNDLRVLRIIKGQHGARSEQQAAVICADLSAL